jgi:hypothetical protein
LGEATKLEKTHVIRIGMISPSWGAALLRPYPELVERVEV